jgi:hypothetical protein
MSNDTQAAARQSDQDLIKCLITMKGQELEIVARSLVYLNEVFRRKLDLKSGYDSLYTFAEKALGYGKDVAYPRIRAAEVLRFAPEFEEHLREGRISMSALKQAQVAFRSEDQRRKKEGADRLRLREKVAVLSELLSSSTRDAARFLAERFPTLDKEKDQERVRPISGGRYVVHIVLTEEEYADLIRLKEITAHTNPEGKNSVVINRAIGQALKKEDAKRNPKAQRPETPTETPPVGAKRNARRPISIKIRREVHARASEQCQFVSPEGVRCQCRYGTEMEHALPIALGGTNDLDNLEILCRAHNGYRAWALGLRPPAEVQGRFQ